MLYNFTKSQYPINAFSLFRFSATHILSNASEAWSGMKGRINETILKANLPVVNPENRYSALVCVCGPEPFTAAIGK